MNESDRASASPEPSADAGAGASDRRPAGFCRGPGHLVVYGNPAFVAAFGAAVVGMPARESLLDLPPTAFALFDAVLARGKPLARWIEFRGEDWRLTVQPRVDPGDGDIYGVTFHMRARGDAPVVASELPGRISSENAE